MRMFRLRRNEDVSGVSGTGIVAEGICFTNNHCVIGWLGEVHSVVVYESVDEVQTIHGHGGSTIIEWLSYCPDYSEWTTDIRKVTDAINCN